MIIAEVETETALGLGGSRDCASLRGDGAVVLVITFLHPKVFGYDSSSVSTTSARKDCKRATCYTRTLLRHTPRRNKQWAARSPGRWVEALLADF